MLQTEKKLTQWRGIVCLTALLFGTESVVIQLAYAGGWSVFPLLTGRYLIASVVLFFVTKAYRVPLLIQKGERLHTLLLVLLQLIVNICLLQALAYLPAALAILFFYAYPALTALVTRVFYHRPLTRTKTMALILSGVGLILLYWT